LLQVLENSGFVLNTSAENCCLCFKCEKIMSTVSVKSNNSFASSLGVRKTVLSFPQVLENQVVPITSSHLAYRDLDTRDRDLVYRLTSLLGADEGTIEHIDFPFKPVLQFTQQDINNNRILYRPPDHEIGLAEKEVSFNFVCKCWSFLPF